jgi:hypothetical protein
LGRAIDQPLPVEEACRQLLVVAGGAHGHRDRLTIHSDLERLLDRHEIAPAIPQEALQGAGCRLVRGRFVDGLVGRHQPPM